MTDITLPPLPPWAQYPDDDSIKDAIQDYARLAVEQNTEKLRAERDALQAIINGDWPKNHKLDQDRVSLPAYVVGLEKQNDKLKAERDALRELLRCVSTNLKKTMSKSMQELQARTIDAAMKEKP